MSWWILLLMLSISPSLLKAQSPNTKFGKPTDEELNMSVYAPDESAEAVVLYKSTKVWYAYIVDDFKLYTEVKARIKVLKPEGVKYANVEVPYVENEKVKSMKETVTGLKAYAYNMENGSMTKTKMENDVVVREQVDKSHKVLKFTVPQVKEGTVIEYQYRIESDYYFYIDTWVAQEEIPVAYTSYSLSIPEYFVFSLDETGEHRLESKVEDESFKFTAKGALISCTGEKYEFVGRDLPAIKDEGYVYCPLDYCNKVSAELRGLDVPGEMYRDLSSSWKEVGLNLMEDEDFGRRIKNICSIKDLLSASGASQNTDVVGKMAAIYTELKRRLKWNGDYKLFGQSLSKVIKDGVGSNADLNLILLSAYREAGLDARPVVMSRRTRGRLPLSHPSVNKLNTFVVGVVDGQTVHFIDGSVEDGYVDVLPSLLLTEQGYLLSEDGTGTWVNLQSLDASKANVIIQATLDEKGLVNGTYEGQMKANLSASLKEDFRTADDSLTYVNKMAERNGVKLSAYAIDERQAFSPTTVERATFAKQCEADGDHIYFEPFLFPPVKESPFKDVKRIYPVEFPYKYSITMVINTTLPDGYTVEELPETLMMRTEDNGLSVRLNYMMQGNTLLVQFRFNVNKTLFLTNEYDMLRQIYDTLVERGGEIIVLKKN